MWDHQMCTNPASVHAWSFSSTEDPMLSVQFNIRQGVLVQLLVCLNVGKLSVITVRNPLLEPISKGKRIRVPQ